MDAAKNFAKGTLSTGYDDTATSIVLTAGDGARFPDAPFNATWWNASDYSDPADDPNVEIVRVTAKSTDTFTVTRGAEGGAGAMAHDLAGRTHKLAAGLTARLINEQLLDVSKSGDDVTITAIGMIAITPINGIMEVGNGALLRLNVTTGMHAIGDLDSNNTGVMVNADDALGQVSLRGKIGTDQSAAATTLGSVVKKLQIFDNSGNSLGYIALYDSIT
jgi:hypothetical protein